LLGRWRGRHLVSRDEDGGRVTVRAMTAVAEMRQEMEVHKGQGEAKFDLFQTVINIDISAIRRLESCVSLP
jgi:hypothetical protein